MIFFKKIFFSDVSCRNGIIRSWWKFAFFCRIWKFCLAGILQRSVRRLVRLQRGFRVSQLLLRDSRGISGFFDVKFFFFCLQVRELRRLVDSDRVQRSVLFREFQVSRVWFQVVGLVRVRFIGFFVGVSVEGVVFMGVVRFMVIVEI